MSKLHLITYGCQMNEYDSERVAGLLKQERLRAHRSPGRRRPDPAQHLLDPGEGGGQGLLAARRAQAPQARSGPDLVIGVMGCMAQLQQGRIQERAPYVDLVFGSPAIARVAELVARARSGAAARARDRRGRRWSRSPRGPTGGQRLKAFVTVMEGCEKYCTFCVVPTTRGRERSHPPEAIVDGDPRARGRRAAARSRCSARPSTPTGATSTPPTDLAGAARARRRHRRHRAHPLHHLEPVQPHPPADPRHPRRAQGVRVPAPAAAVGLGPRARADEPRLHPRPLPRADRGAPGDGARTSRSPPTSSWASPARPRRTSSRRWRWSRRSATTTSSPSATRAGPGTPAAEMADQVPEDGEGGPQHAASWRSATRVGAARSRRLEGRTLAVLVDGVSRKDARRGDRAHPLQPRGELRSRRSRPAGRRGAACASPGLPHSLRGELVAAGRIAASAEAR